MAAKLANTLATKGDSTVTGIQFLSYVAVSEDELTQGLGAGVSEFQLEHLSLRDSSNDPLLPPAKRLGFI